MQSRDKLTMKSANFRTILNALSAAIISVTAIGCSGTLSDKGNVQEISDDAPMSEFVLGSWKTEHVFLPNGNESSFDFDIKFTDYDTVEVVVIENGDPTEITISQYSFVAPDTIFVDNKRIRGGETWFLERDDQKLKIHLEINDGKEGIDLVLIRK